MAKSNSLAVVEFLKGQIVNITILDAAINNDKGRELLEQRAKRYAEGIKDPTKTEHDKIIIRPTTASDAEWVNKHRNGKRL